jgi:hypothetical protein
MGVLKETDWYFLLAAIASSIGPSRCECSFKKPANDFLKGADALLIHPEDRSRITQNPIVKVGEWCIFPCYRSLDWIYGVSESEGIPRR